MYNNYKKARNMSWEVLLKCGIRELPVDLNAIANFYGIKISLYSDTNLTQLFKEDVLAGDGFIISNNGEKQIYLNNKINNQNRRRFTVAHELGHGILNHNILIVHYRNSEIDSETDLQELEANVFARDLTMPATVLAALNIHRPDEIMKLCNISKKSAEIRAKRMALLYERNVFNTHPIEREVRKQFDDFIKKKRYLL